MARKIKIHSTKQKKQSAPKQAEQPQQSQDDPRDVELLEKLEDLHVYLTQRGLPYLIATKGESGKPLGRFSFNHEHNKPEQTVVNGEFICVVIANMLTRVSGGRIQLIKQY